MAENKPFFYDLKNLPPEARERVEAVLKRTLEAELQAEARDNGGGSDRPAFSRSRGPIFSRSKAALTVRGLDESGDAEMLRDITHMGDDEFKKFAERLSALRKLKQN